MKHARITIAELTLVILVVAIGLGAIRGNSPAWAGAMTSITYFALICALLGIALGRGLRRAYWSGFATLGWSYLLLIYVPWLFERVGTNLLAPNLFEYLEVVLHPDPTQGQGLQSLPILTFGATVTGGAFNGSSASVTDLSNFVRIGIAMEALIWAFLGGWIARYFASDRDGSRTLHVPAPAGPPDSRG